MNNGKEVCKRLKEVRREIAKANHIPLIQEECKHEGDCMGTCPKCEQEVRYLERELDTRSKLGKAASIIGIAWIAGSMALTSCSTEEPTGGVPVLAGEPYEEEVLEGDPIYEMPDESTETNNQNAPVIQIP